jgi:DNA replication protein DnaC
MAEKADDTSLEDLKRLQERSRPRDNTQASMMDGTFASLQQRALLSPGGLTREEWDRERAEHEKARNERQEQRRRIALVETIAKDLGLRYSRERTSLDLFETKSPQQEAVKKLVLEIGHRLPVMTERGEGVVLYGTVGSAKDHLMAALLYQAAETGITCRRINGQDFFGRVRDSMDDHGESERKILDELSTPQVLAISDPIPPANSLSDFRLELLYRLVNRRYEMLRPTWATMNVESPEEADQLLSSQTWDRLQEGAELIACFWPSHRKPKTRRQNAGVSTKRN